jgi:hypothetical protein
MKAFRLFLRVTGWISFAAWIALVFYNPPLPAPADVLPEIKTEEPKQVAGSGGELNLDIDAYQYTLQPSYRYDLKGVVVSLYDSDSWFDLAHQDDPGNIRDLCVVWGQNVASGSYRNVRYKSGEFTCSFSWSPTLDPPFDIHGGSNNHVLPATATVAKKLKSVIRGDQIRLQGYLTNYTVQDAQGRKLYTRNTSTSRDDRGNGACEIVYVTDIEILKATDRLPYGARTVGLWTWIGALIVRLILVFAL